MKFPVRAVALYDAEPDSPPDSPPPRPFSSSTGGGDFGRLRHTPAAIQLPTQEPKDDAEAAQQQRTVDRQDRPRSQVSPVWPVVLLDACR